jgi:hypothetical protein
VRHKVFHVLTRDLGGRSSDPTRRGRDRLIELLDRAGIFAPPWPETHVMGGHGDLSA